MLFTQFVFRSLRYFQRNIAAGALPFVMPLIFLFLFVSSSTNLSQAPQLTLEQVGEPVLAEQKLAVDRLQRSGLFNIIESSATSKSTLSFDGQITLSQRDSGVQVLLKPGFQHWGGLISHVSAGGVTNARTANIAIKYGKIERASYLEFIIPGLFVMALIQIATSATAGVILDDRADGTLRMVASARRALLPYFAAELTTRLVFASVSYLFMAILVTLLAGFSPLGGWMLFTVLYALGAVTMISFGIMVGGVLPTRSGWASSITILSLLMWFFSDILFQATQHPAARPIALLMPSTYLTDSLRQISTSGAGSFAVWQDALVMIIIASTSVGLSAKFFKFDTND